MLAFAMPIALLTVLAMRRWLHGTAGLGTGVLLLAAYALHPPAVLPLAPLVLMRPSRPAMRSPYRSALSERTRVEGGEWTISRITGIVCAVSLVVLAIALMAVTPSCGDVELPGSSLIAKEVFAVLRDGAGLTVGLLAILHVVTRTRS